MDKKIAHRIRKIRESKDLTQENMADELGITFGAYSKIERGETDPNASRLLQIAKILEVSVIDFFEDAVAAFREQNGGYGFATREEMANLTKVVNILAQKIERLTQDSLSKKSNSGKRSKKSS